MRTRMSPIRGAADLHHLRSERARDVDIRRVVMSFDEGDAGRVALDAMTGAAAQAGAVVAGFWSDTEQIALVLRGAFVSVRTHP